MQVQSLNIKRLLTLRLNPGDDVLDSVTAAARENGIANGIVLGAVGSLTSYHVHIPESNEMPPRDVFFGGEGVYDILNLTGPILDGRVHAHLTLSDTEKAMGGHLEKGCRIFTWGFVVIAETPDAKFADLDRIDFVEN